MTRPPSFPALHPARMPSPPDPMMPPPRSRSRVLFLLLAAGCITLGLATRHRSIPWLPFVTAYAGDVLWATLVFLLLAIVWHRASTRALALGAGAFALPIELGQLYHAPWIAAVRATRLGGLVLGFGFLWSDLACYAVGIALAAALDRWLGRRRPAAMHPAGG